MLIPIIAGFIINKFLFLPKDINKFPDAVIKNKKIKTKIIKLKTWNIIFLENKLFYFLEDRI